MKYWGNHLVIQMSENQTEQPIKADMTIGDLVQKYPSAAEVLMDEGVHCVGCGAAYWETIEEGLMGHGKSEDEIKAVLQRLNDSIPEESGEKGQLIITSNAAKKAKEFLEKQKDGMYFRVEVIPGGCSGHQYHFDFDDMVDDEDQIMDIDGVKFVIDKESLEMMRGSKLDYVDSMQGSGFKVSNPNAAKTCGCGQSFS